MIKTEQKTQTIDVRKRYCDDCGKFLPSGMACSVARCEYCGKDLCNSCIGHEEHNSSDSREVYCKRCWDIGKPYREEIAELEERVELLYGKWIEAINQ